MVSYFLHVLEILHFTIQIQLCITILSLCSLVCIHIGKYSPNIFLLKKGCFGY
jgi:hypothetical protein